MIRLLLANDQELIRSALSALLSMSSRATSGLTDLRRPRPHHRGRPLRQPQSSSRDPVLCRRLAGRLPAGGRHASSLAVAEPSAISAASLAVATTTAGFSWRQ